MKVVEKFTGINGKAHGQENWQSLFVSKDAEIDAAIVILC